MIECTFPTGSHISPGTHKFRLHDTDAEDDKDDAFVEMEVDENLPILLYGGKKFIVVKDIDEEFWGPGGKAAYLERLKWRASAGMMQLANQGLFDYDPVKDMPLMIPIPFKISEWQTFAQVLKEIKVFESIGQAKKAGWDKPLTLGIHEFTKKRIRIEVIE